MGYRLWIDTARWPTFIDGFKHLERQDAEWPNEGAKLVWTSPPAGRGTVTERVVTNEPGKRFATRIFEERVTGVQTAYFAPTGLFGLVYWYLLYPIHGIIFSRLIRGVAEGAVARAGSVAP